MQWFRWYRGTCSDPKLGGIARTCRQPKPTVIAVWALCLESASEQHETGMFAATVQDIADTLGLRDETVQRVLTEMEQRGMLEEGRIVAWERRQFISDDVTKRTRNTKAKAKGTLEERSGNVPGTPKEQKGTSSDSDADSDSDSEVGKGSAPPAGDAAQEAPVKKLTPQQEAIATAWAAHGWGAMPKNPAGYSGLTALVAEHGCPAVLAWANVVNGEEPQVPEGADAWRCFCQRFRAAMKRPWEWDGSRKPGGKPSRLISAAEPELREGPISW